MEKLYAFRIYYLGQYIFTITSHTKWEAVEKAMSRTGWKYERKNFRTKIWKC